MHSAICAWDGDVYVDRDVPGWESMGGDLCRKRVAPARA